MAPQNVEIWRDVPPVERDSATSGSWLKAVIGALQETPALIAVIGLYAIGAVITAYILDESLVSSVVGYGEVALLVCELCLCLGALWLLVSIGIRERPARPARRLLQEIHKMLRPERAARALLLLLAFLAVQAIYVFFKPLIPQMVPFSWDPALARLDRVLFLGNDPWTVLWVFLGNGPATLFINVAYHLWFFWLVLTQVAVAFAEKHRTENVRYFLACTLVWIVGGTMLAAFFSSVGPCYYAFVFPGIDPFAPLLAGLDAINEHIPVFARGVQAMLWEGQMNLGPGKLAGISAMPSMHCAMAFLMTRIAFVHGSRLGIASAAMTALIFTGSIHLGWHYACDGLAGFAVAAAAWAVAGAVLRRTASRPAVTGASIVAP